MNIPGVEWVKSHPLTSALVVIGGGALLYFATSGGGGSSAGYDSADGVYGTSVSFTGPSDASIQAATSLQIAQMDKQFQSDALAAEYIYKSEALNATKDIQLQGLANEDASDAREFNLSTLLAQIGERLDSQQMNIAANAYNATLINDYATTLSNNQTAVLTGVNSGYYAVQQTLASKQKSSKSKGISISTPFGGGGISF